MAPNNKSAEHWLFGLVSHCVQHIVLNIYCVQHIDVQHFFYGHPILEYSPRYMLNIRNVQHVYCSARFYH